MQKNSLVALVVTSYVLTVFNCFCPIYLLFCFLVFPFFKIFWVFSWSKFWYFIEEFSNDCLSRPINSQLWHARVGLFNNGLNKRNKAIFPLHLSSDLSKSLACILLSNLRSAYQLCNYLLISVALHYCTSTIFFYCSREISNLTQGLVRVQLLSLAIGI